MPKNEVSKQTRINKLHVKVWTCPLSTEQEPEVRGEQEVLMADLEPIKLLSDMWRRRSLLLNVVVVSLNFPNS